VKVVTGTKTVTGQTLEVELEDSDGFQQFPEWEYYDIPTRFKKLSAYAEVLLVNYLFRGGYISESDRNQKLTHWAKELK